MSFRLPTIESKNRLPEEQDYNFVNKQRGKKPPLQQKEQPGLQLIEELKRKIEEQKREIDTRNNTIMAIQRNFQSMSVLLKNEKLENTGIRDENDKLKKQIDEVGKRAAQFHEKSLTLGNEVKRLKEQLLAGQEEKRSSKKQQESQDTLKKIIADLEANVVNLSSRLIESENERKAGQLETSKLKSVEKERRQLSERLVDLEEQLHKKSERVNYLQLELKRNDDELKLLKQELHRKDISIEELKKKEKDGKSKQNSSLDELRLSRQHIADLEASELRMKQLLENKQVVIAVKIKAEQQHKQLINDLKHKEEQLRRTLMGREKQLKETSELLANSLRNIEDKDQMLIKNQSDIAKLKGSAAELELKLRQTEQQLIRAESNNQFLNDKTVSTSEKMDSLANDINTLRKEKQVLQQSAQQHERQVLNLNEIIKRYQHYDEFIAELERHGGQAKLLSTAEHQSLLKSLQSYRREEQKLQRMIQQQKERLEVEAAERRAAMLMLENYQQEEAQLRNIIDVEKQQLLKLSSEKQLKQQEVEQERNNNKLLWSDNKKLKEKEQLLAQLEREHQELQRKKSQELKELEQKKEKELEKRAGELKEKYEAELSDLKRSISTNGELSNILLQKSNHIGKLEQELSKTVAELEFYRNRNKQLEGVVGRTEKRFKEAEHVYLEENQKLRKEAKSHGSMITALTDKISSLEKDRKQAESLLEMNKKLNTEVQRLQQHSASLEQKLSQVNFQELDRQRRENEKKLLVIRKSIDDLGESLTACTNNLNCCHCGELPVDSVKLIPCGHVYCKKCKAGYDPNCGQCKVAGQPHTDRVNDQTIKKFRFMQTILTMLKENTKVLG